MAPDPTTLTMSLATARAVSTRLPRWSALARNPLTMVVTSPAALDGCQQMAVELHAMDSTGHWARDAAAAATVEFPTGAEHTVEFTGAQMALDLAGAKGMELLITVGVVRADGTPDAWIAGQLTLAANPWSGLEPPEPPDPIYVYVTADLMAAEVAARLALAARVAALEHVPMDITSLAVSPAVAEAGSTVASLTFTWARNKVPATLAFNQGIGAITPATLTAVTKTVSITADTTYTLTADDGTAYAGHEDTASATVLFQRRMHWGTAAAATLDSAGILALDSNAFATSRARAVTVNGGGQYIYFAYPAAFGDAAFLVNGLTSTAWVKTTVSHTNASGSTVSYNVYRSTTVQNGTGIQITVQ